MTRANSKQLGMPQKKILAIDDLPRYTNTNYQTITHKNTTIFTRFGNGAHVHGKEKCLFLLSSPLLSESAVIHYIIYIIFNFLAPKKAMVQVPKYP